MTRTEKEKEMTIQMQVDMVLVEKGDGLCVYQEMVDVEQNCKKLSRPICIETAALQGEAPEIITLRVEIASKDRPVLEITPAGNEPPTILA